MLEMSLTSVSFFAFFIVSLIVYYLVPGSIQWVILLISSIVFFVFSSTPYTGIYLLISIVSTTLCAKVISQGITDENKKKSRNALLIGIIINVGILAVLKYTNFLINNLNSVMKMMHIYGKFNEMEWAAPLGISFYTMMIVAYLLDVYWETVPAQQNIFKTALFVGYYPQLTSGPITRYRQMKDSLYGEHKFNEKNIVFGMQRMLWGVFKKLVLSARIGILVDAIYNDTTTYNGFYIWYAAAMFMLQLYTDFSGCMDIVIGASECYGITLPENFRTPFFSRSVQEYWQRWHITLGAWLKDYILYPILKTGTWRKLTKFIKSKWGKKASKQIPTYLGMLCVWLLIGLWHGGKWKYIFGMGLWFWSCIVLSQILDPVFKKMIKSLRINTECFSWHLFQSLRVFILVSFGNMFFRLNGFKTTIKTILKGFSCWNPEIFFDDSLLQLGLDYKNFHIMSFGLLILLLVSVMQEKGSVRERLAHQNVVFRWGILLLLIFSILIFGMYGAGFDAQSFIYEQF